MRDTTPIIRPETRLSPRGTPGGRPTVDGPGPETLRELDYVAESRAGRARLRRDEIQLLRGEQVVRELDPDLARRMSALRAAVAAAIGAALRGEVG